LKCDPTSAGRSLVVPGAELRSDRGGRSEQVRIVGVRQHKGRLLVAIEGVADVEAAQRFVGATFFAPRVAIELGEGEYLDEDLVGCAVRASDGRSYGTVERVEHYPASDMLVIGGRMLPMVSAFIRAIDVEQRSIVVGDLPEGLLEPLPDAI
jgi:16S rRNA processing protein RimM